MCYRTGQIMCSLHHTKTTLIYVTIYGIIYGILARETWKMLHERTQKITTHIPVNLLHDAQAVTGKGITETVKLALTQLARTHAYDDLRNMRGKIKFSIDLKELRKDR